MDKVTLIQYQILIHRNEYSVQYVTTNENNLIYRYYWFCGQKSKAIVTFQVDAFLKTIDLRPPDISFGGYVTVNRGMLLSVSSDILLQFCVQCKIAARSTVRVPGERPM